MVGDEVIRTNRSMLRVRDLIDRDFADELDISALAATAFMSRDHLIRTFARTFGETPHRYLQRRRIERAMFLLRTTRLSVTDVCIKVGYSSLGAFSDLFAATVGMSPSAYRADRDNHPPGGVHGAFVKAWTRPSTHVDASISKKRTAEDRQ